MIRLAGLAQNAVLKEGMNFTNWKKPDLDKLKTEFKVEHELKRNDFFDNEQDFLNRVKQGKVVSLSRSQDRAIAYRSRTETFDELHDLIKTYSSYPEYRNEETLKNLYKGFVYGKPMELPIVIEFANGAKRVFSGNTRLDVAFQLDVTPVKVLLIKSDRTW